MKKFIDFCMEKLAAYEGGDGPIIISYDDATFNYIIIQKRCNGNTETLGCSRSLHRAFELAMNGKVFD